MAAGVIFLRAATNAAATWRVAAVLVLVFVVFVATVGAASAAFFFVGISAFREVSAAAFVAPAVLELETLDPETWDFETWDFETWDFEADASFREDGVCACDADPALEGGISAFLSRRSRVFKGVSRVFEGVVIAALVGDVLLAARAAARGLAADAFRLGADAVDFAAADLTGTPRAAAVLTAGACDACADARFVDVVLVAVGPPRAVRPAATLRFGATANFAAAACFDFVACFGLASCFDFASCFGLALPASSFIREVDSETARAADFVPP